jgi:hypothetical protein
MVRGHVTTMGKGATKLVDYDPELTCKYERLPFHVASPMLR